MSCSSADERGRNRAGAVSGLASAGPVCSPSRSGWPYVASATRPTAVRRGASTDPIRRAPTAPRAAASPASRRRADVARPRVRGARAVSAMRKREAEPRAMRRGPAQTARAHTAWLRARDPCGRPRRARDPRFAQAAEGRSRAATRHSKRLHAPPQHAASAAPIRHRGHRGHLRFHGDRTEAALRVPVQRRRVEGGIQGRGRLRPPP